MWGPDEDDRPPTDPRQADGPAWLAIVALGLIVAAFAWGVVT